jgi:hypothetical protein
MNTTLNGFFYLSNLFCIDMLYLISFKMKQLSLILLISLIFLLNLSAQNTAQKPLDFFGFAPGSDKNVFTYEQLISYLQKLDASSDRLQMLEIGKSPMGKPMYIAFISDPANISRLEELKGINKKLALNDKLTDQQQGDLIARGRVFVLATLSMHSDEVGPTQSLPIIAYDLCTTNDPEKLKWMSEVVYMVVPNHNPDGMDMIVDYYNKTKGTKLDGSDMPGVYHKYVGHDNNRDFVTLSQEDTKVIARIYNQDWFPQVFVEKHQMGSTGTRYFVPPNHDPIAENVDAGIWNWTGVFGSNLLKDMTEAGCAGVSQHYLFDDYWPGSTETCIWKNVIGFLTESASANVASPVYVEPTELSVGGKGLSEYKKSINMPLPWEGGWWKLSDIVKYEIVSTESILKTAYTNRDAILKYRNDICKKQVMLGLTTAPYYYILPSSQNDPGELVYIVNLLKEHGISVFSLTGNVQSGNLSFSNGDVIIPLAQPFRAFIKEVMEKQVYPVRRYTPGGEIIKPYDIASWSLPLHNGVKSFEITEVIEGISDKMAEIKGTYTLVSDPGTHPFLAFPVTSNESFRLAFEALSAGNEVWRTDKDISVNGNKLPSGSFVIKTPTDAGAVKKLLETYAVAAIGLDSQSEGKTLKMPRIAVLESWFHDMDAGWLRYVMDSYSIPFKVLHPADIKTEDLTKYDVIILPDENKSVLMDGKYKSGESYYVSSYDPMYTKGMEKDGLSKLMKFFNDGGKIVAWGEAAGLFEGLQTIQTDKENKEEFQLPFTNLAESLQKSGVYCPGSLIRMKVRDNSPLTFGMPSETGIFYRGRPAFSTSVPTFDMDRRVIGVFPEENILMSGYCEKEEKLANIPIMIWLKKGKGQMVLMGFSPQFRASTHATYKLLFNSILLN